MTFNQIDRQECKIIREVAIDALKKAFSEYNIEVTSERGTFDRTFASLKFQFALKGATGQAETRQAVDFKRYAHMYGLNPEDLGRMFLSAGSLYTITGAKPDAPRFPITATRTDGKTFKFPPDTVRRALKPTSEGG